MVADSNGKMNLPASKEAAEELQLHPQPFLMCESCNLRKHCWRPDLKPDQIAINLLTCRLQTRSGFDAAAAQLLPEIMPGIARGVETAKRYFPLRESTEDLIQEAQAPLIESLITKFRFSRRMHPLRWLFGSKAKVRLTGIPQGALALWLRTRLRKEAGRPDKERDGHEAMHGHLPEDAGSAELESIEAEAHDSAIATYERLISRLRDDGQFLEARILARASAYLKTRYRQPLRPDRALLDACSDLGAKRATMKVVVAQHVDIWQDHLNRHEQEKTGLSDDYETTTAEKSKTR